MRPKNHLYINFFRPIADALLALFLLLPAMLLMAVVATALLLQGQGVFYVQRRQGYRGRLFWVYKFKTIAGGPGPSAANEQKRVTPVGKILRSTGLDELPQLFQVLSGHLALVGPRPLLPEYAPHYSPSQLKRFAVRPGITGLAQIKGGNALPWAQKLRLDSWYAQHASFWLDAYIVYHTFVQLYLPGKRHPQAGAPSTRFDQVVSGV